MRVLAAPQEFKGSLTASEAAQCIAEGVRDRLPNADVDQAAMSDGGPGLVQALLAALGGAMVRSPVHDPLMRRIDASWALLSNGVAAIEMAAAAGLVLLRDDELQPLRATTFGVGELLLAALDRGCAEVILGVGGSATTDAGVGALQALGARFLDADGQEIAAGAGAPTTVASIDVSGVDARLRGPRVRVASDVTSKLTGPHGAARMFSPQKGATPQQVETLEAALSRFAAIAARDTGVDVTSARGSGAAGGLGAGLMIVGATIEPGFPLVAEAIHLRERMDACDLVITGEGRLDAQTAYGKVAGEVAHMAKAAGKPCAMIAGVVRDDFGLADSPFDCIEVLSDGHDTEAAIREAGPRLRDAARRIAARYGVRR
jgi:glycerate kinase